MIQIRIHGRGGQGVVTAAELLSVAAFQEGLFAQAIPSFGSERMGAPVVAFCRMHDLPIRNREPVYHPDWVLIQDSTLLHQVNVFDGIAPHATVLINSTRSLEALGLTDYVREHPDVRMVTLRGSEIAMKHQGRPLANVALVAGYVALSGMISLESLIKAITARFKGELGAVNVKIAEESFRLLEGITAGPASIVNQGGNHGGAP